MALPRPSARPRSGGRPTLDEVAARAGVGRGTVSRVVNGSSQVSAETKAAVEQAISELGYVPNRAARALVTRRTDAVALVICEAPGRVFGEAFLAGVIRGINAVLVQTPLQLWLAMCQSAAERDRVERHLTPQHIDGVLFMSVTDDDPLPAVLVRRGLAVVRVVGFDDPAATPPTGPAPTRPAPTGPALTATHQPVAALGSRMATLLLAHIRGDATPAPLVVLDTHLVVRVER